MYQGGLIKGKGLPFFGSHKNLKIGWMNFYSSRLPPGSSRRYFFLLLGNLKI
jgi:hypothetical protein